MSANPFKATSVLGIVRGWDECSGADFLKSDNSGHWTQNGAPAHPGPYLPMNYRFVFQRWQDGRVLGQNATDADQVEIADLSREERVIERV